MSASTLTDQNVLDELVRRIVEAVQPRRIVFFGSAARGEMGRDSDLDVPVVMPDGVHRRHTAQTIYQSLAGFGIAKDVGVVTESDVRDHGGNPSLVLFPALNSRLAGRVAGACSFAAGECRGAEAAGGLPDHATRDALAGSPCFVMSVRLET